LAGHRKPGGDVTALQSVEQSGTRNQIGFAFEVIIPYAVGDAPQVGGEPNGGKD
jgi:hypothetical protein